MDLTPDHFNSSSLDDPRFAVSAVGRWLLGESPQVPASDSVTSLSLSCGIWRLDVDMRCALLVPLAFRDADAELAGHSGALGGLAFDFASTLASMNRPHIRVLCGLDNGMVSVLPASVVDARMTDIGRCLSAGLLALPAASRAKLSRSETVVCLGPSMPRDDCIRLSRVLDAALRGSEPRARISRNRLNFAPSPPGHGDADAAVCPPGPAGTLAVAYPALQPAAGTNLNLYPADRLLTVVTVDDDAGSILDSLAGTLWEPFLGQGRAVATGTSGALAMTCAASTVTQLLLPHDADLGAIDRFTADIAVTSRRWAGLHAASDIPLADAWMVGVALVRPVGAVPRLLMLTTYLRGDAQHRHRVAEGRHVTVIAAPRQWDGTYVVAIGSGSHFDPVVWRHLAQSSWVAPGSTGVVFRPPTMTTDMGPSACALVLLGAVWLGSCSRAAATDGALRLLVDPLDYDQGVVATALRLIAATAHDPPFPLAPHADAGRVDGILACRQPDAFPMTAGRTHQFLDHLLHHALWAPTAGATRFLLIAGDEFRWVLGTIDADSMATDCMGSIAVRHQGASGSQVL